MTSTLKPRPFDPDTATSREWAFMYRQHGLQVVPARYPMLVASDKRPSLSHWGEFQDALAPEALADTWFTVGVTTNMGLITGRASQNIFVIDLDDPKGLGSREWWSTHLEIHNIGMELETWCQTTGGGGRQLFFRAPAGWHAPTNRTPIGVDIRGQGGFAMLPPSEHMSGGAYAWDDGYAPWECAILNAPQWLLDAVDALVEQSGGDRSREATGLPERAPGTGQDFDPFGARIDGREDAATKWVWGAVVGLHRETGGVLPDDRGAAQLAEVIQGWERHTKTRLNGVDNAEGLERECRGRSLITAKWKKALAKWNGKVAEAARARPFVDEAAPTPPPLDPERELVDPETGNASPLIVRGDEFVRGYRPPEYLIDGMMQRGYLYSLTARTGHGKTAVSMLIAQAVARGTPVGDRFTLGGSVLFLAGENPDDVRARYMVLADHHGFGFADAPIYFLPGVVDISETLPEIRQKAADIPDLRLIIVDTAAAYFRGDDTNSNAQQGAYARLLRQLTTLPGNPAVLVPCHPVKNASRSNLTPGGGGAFLNEVDGNLTLWADAEKTTTLHHQGKFRGPEFEPLSFRLRTVTSVTVVDSNGALMPSVVAEPISDAEADASEARQAIDSRSILRAIAAHKDASVSRLAEACGFVGAGGPQKSKTFRILQDLVDDRLVERVLKKYRLTAKGEEALGSRSHGKGQPQRAEGGDYGPY